MPAFVRVSVVALACAWAGAVAASPEPPATGASPEPPATAYRIERPPVRLIAPAEVPRQRAEALAAKAHDALLAAAAFWRVAPPDVSVVLRNDDDRFRAWAEATRPPVVVVPVRRAAPDGVGGAAADPERLLLVHEMIHAVHLAGRPPPLPFGAGAAFAHLPWPPPAWLLEGVAVVAESRLLQEPAGRLDDPGARAVLRTLAQDGGWPDLDDAALITHAAWPGGQLRYLAGGALVARMIDDAGHDAFLAALRRYERQAPWLGFVDAWRAETGGDLHATWRALGEELRTEAEAHPNLAGGPVAIHGRADDAPVRADRIATSPNGRQVARVAGRELTVAGRGDAPAVLAESDATVTLAGAPNDLAWTDADRLVVVRAVDRPEATTYEVVQLRRSRDGAGPLREVARTRGARARAVAPWGPPGPDRAVAVLHEDAAGGSGLGRLAPDGTWRPMRLRAPDGVRFVGLTTDPTGRPHLLLDRDGARTLHPVTSLATAEGWRLGRGRPLSGRGARDPTFGPDGRLAWIAWDGTDEVAVAAGPDGTVRTIARPLGGTVALAPDGTRGWWITTRTPEGTVARRIGGAAATDAQEAAPDAGPDLTPGVAAFPPPAAGRSAPAPYRPFRALAPIGWRPTALDGGGFAVRWDAIDPTRTAGVTVHAGLAPLADGPLGAVAFGATVRAGEVPAMATSARPAPASAELALGLTPFAPHRASVTGPRPTFRATVRAVLSAEPRITAAGTAGIVAIGGTARPFAALAASGSRGRSDAWGVPRDGVAFAVRWRDDPLPGGGRSSGAWADTAIWRSLGSAGDLAWVGQAGARAGVRPPAPVPGPGWRDVAVSGRIGVEATVPVRLRVADGRWAWERLRVRPELRLGWRTDAERPLAWAAALRADLDLVAGYGAPLSIGVVAGVASGGASGAHAFVRLAAPTLP